MSERDRAMALAMLCEAFGVKADTMAPARIRIYEQALQKVPKPCLEPMTKRAIETRRPRYGDLPTVADLLEDAEWCRLELVRALKYDPEGCGLCEGTGWQRLTEGNVERVLRCACWRRHQEQVQALGVGHQPLALPVGSDA